VRLSDVILPLVIHAVFALGFVRGGNRGVKMPAGVGNVSDVGTDGMGQLSAALL
jgi:hypothetical protein